MKSTVEQPQRTLPRGGGRAMDIAHPNPAWRRSGTAAPRWAWATLLAGTLIGTQAASPSPLRANDEDSLQARWLNKPVLGSRVLDDMEQAGAWEHRGYGAASFTTERSQDGVQSIRLTSPTLSDKPNTDVGRPFGEAELVRKFAGENWSNYNRLSFWVYPTLPGFKTISLLVKLRNEGATPVPDRYGREGLNYVLLEPDRWNHVVWEIPHLARDKVTGVSFVYRLQGNEPGATNTVCYDLDRLELQKVQADSFEGWAPPAGKIVFSHSGYAVGSAKSALVGETDATTFSLRREDTGETVVRRPIYRVTTPLGGFGVLEFSDVRAPGPYVLQVGGAVTRPFWIRESAWRDTVWKTVNLFYGERCGAAIPGVHEVCHEDWRAEHAGQTRTINGGWHDAGDLSQGAVNTAEAVYAMFSLAESLRALTPPAEEIQREPAPARNSKKALARSTAKQATAPPPLPATPEAQLERRLIEEAKWGLDWLRRTRFGDGYRVTWATMDYWTDNLLGTVDDTLGNVGDAPFDNYLAAAAEAVAARVLRPSAALLAEGCLRDAEADWKWANERTQAPGVELAAAGMQASIELYRTTGQARFLNRALELAPVVLDSQQRTYLNVTPPLSGFFYTDPGQRRLLHYNHRSHEQASIVALVALCQELPDHPDWMKWYSAVALHAEYQRTLAEQTRPYGLLAAGLYRLDESTDPSYQAQVRNGAPLGDGYYLKRFPTWTAFRGNYGVALSQACGLAAAARLRVDPTLADVCQAQLQWVVGRNPFAQSTMYGEGGDFAPQYTAMSGNLVGSLPVGVQTREDLDLPYWPAANCYNYKEVWVHPSTRWLMLANELDLPAQVNVATERKLLHKVEIREVREKKPQRLRPDRQGRVRASLSQGLYTISDGDSSQQLTVLPGSRHEVDLLHPCDFEVFELTRRDGAVTIRVEARGRGTHRFALRCWNLNLPAAPRQVELGGDTPTVLEWTGTVMDPNAAWTAVVIPNGTLERRKEIGHYRR